MATFKPLRSCFQFFISRKSIPLKNRLLLLKPSQITHSHSFQTSYPEPSRHSSVNAAEVAHFNALASTWWDYHGPSRLLHLLNPLRHDFINRCLDDSTPKTKSPQSALNSDPRIDENQKLDYLDVGCGGGIFAESIARLSNVRSVTAIDPSPDVIAVAKAHARRDPILKERLNYRNITIESMQIPTSTADQYDVLTLFEVIEHITYPSEFLEKCTKFVRPGGWIVLSTVARTWLSWLTTIAVAEHVLRIVPAGTHNWEKYINPDELSCWFRERVGWNSKPKLLGVVYIPGIGWKPVSGSEKVGNYFFGIRRDF
ncbi:Ubiquinone biosynthesis O-methyltransferase, mitochondrial [Erysiphe necator]|nr:Ubiquinone biosynthesis O-methyltransferase, mitochondrial [Erysiphe necator]